MSKMNITEATMLALQGKLITENKKVKTETRHLTAGQKKIIKQYVQDKNAGKDVEWYQLISDLENINDYETLNQDVRRYIDDLDLNENKSIKNKKQENIDINVDNTNVSVMDNETIVDTEENTIIVSKKNDDLESNTLMGDANLPIEAEEDVVEIPVEGDETIIPEEIVDEPAAEEETSIEDTEKVEPSEDNKMNNEFDENKKVEARERITKDTYVIQGNYGQGWEEIYSSEDRKDAKDRLKEYNDNEKEYPHRLISHRVKKENKEKCDNEVCECDKKVESKKLQEKLGYEPGICPECGSDDLSYEKPISYTDIIEYPFHCNNCGKDGTERYNLDFAEIETNELEESKKVTKREFKFESKKLQEEISDEVYECASQIAKEIEKVGCMNFTEIQDKIMEIMHISVDDMINDSIDNEVYQCLNMQGISNNFGDGDFFTEEYANEHPEVLEENKELKEDYTKNIATINKNNIYDEMCHVLTDYENNDASEDDLYKMLVKIQNNWEEVITFQESKKLENVDIEISEDGKEIEVTTDEGEVVETKDETPDDVERPTIETDNEDEEDVVEENKKLQENAAITPFKDLMYECIDVGIETAEDMCNRLIRAWSEDDCQWYCETYELVEVLDNGDDDHYYKDILGNIRDISGEITGEADDLEESKKRKIETIKRIEARKNKKYEAIERYKNKCKANTKKIWNITGLNEALSKVLKIENVESAKITESDGKLLLRAKITENNEVKRLRFTLTETSNANNFIRYTLKESKVLTNENKSNIDTYSMLVHKNDKNLDCKYIIKK